MDYNWEDKMRLVDSLCGPIAESPRLQVGKSGWIMFAPGLRLLDDRQQEPVMEAVGTTSGSPEAAVEAWWKACITGYEEDVHKALAVIDSRDGAIHRLVTWDGIAFADVWPAFRSQLLEANPSLAWLAS